MMLYGSQGLYLTRGIMGLLFIVVDEFFFYSAGNNLTGGAGDQV